LGPRAASRELDLVIAASAILQDAALWTLTPRDFADIPRLRLAAVQHSVPGR
jgi:predicted nucleic acid-binding protein